MEKKVLFKSRGSVLSFHILNVQVFIQQCILGDMKLKPLVGKELTCIMWHTFENSAGNIYCRFLGLVFDGTF